MNASYVLQISQVIVILMILEQLMQIQDMETKPQRFPAAKRKYSEYPIFFLPELTRYHFIVRVFRMTRKLLQSHIFLRYRSYVFSYYVLRFNDTSLLRSIERQYKSNIPKTLLNQVLMRLFLFSCVKSYPRDFFLPSILYRIYEKMIIIVST